MKKDNFPILELSASPPIKTHKIRAWSGLFSTVLVVACGFLPTELDHPDVEPHSDPDEKQDLTQFPSVLVGVRVDLGERLAERGSVQLFLLLQSQFLPVALFLLTEHLEEAHAGLNKKPATG